MSCDENIFLDTVVNLFTSRPLTSVYGSLCRSCGLCPFTVEGSIVADGVLAYSTLSAPLEVGTPSCDAEPEDACIYSMYTSCSAEEA